MSNSKLVDWFESLVFGSHRFQRTPVEAKVWQVRLVNRGISISDTMANGGLVQTPYLIAGDLNRLIEYFESINPQNTPGFQTGLVTRCFNHLLFLFRNPQPPEEPESACDDQIVLRSILDGDTGEPKAYTCAKFWGNLARRLLNERRPYADLAPLSAPRERHLKNAIRLYDVTCKTVGRWMDPLDMKLVPRSDFVDPVHFQNGKTLEAFVLTHPKHKMSKAIQDFVMHQVVDRILDGRRRDLPFRHEGLDILLGNAESIDRHLRRVDENDTPPKFVDTFQRLIATCGLDHLWVSVSCVEPNDSGDQNQAVWELTHKLHLAERQIEYLLSQLQKH